MSKVILKNSASELVVKIVTESDTTITFDDGALNGKTPTVYHIREVIFNKDPLEQGRVQIIRNSEIVLDLGSTFSMNTHGIVFNEQETHPIEIKTCGQPIPYTLILSLSKQFTVQS